MNPVLYSNEIPAEIVEDLEMLVQGRLSGRVYDFRLLPRGEGLVLQGHAHTYYAKQLAQATLMAVSDYPIVANEIEVI
jgi:hypothetical protein